MTTWNLAHAQRALDGRRRERAAELAVERGLVAALEPLEALVERGALSEAQAEALLAEVDARAFLPATDRYEILSQIGQGGMARVYRARDRQLGRVVALKLIHEGRGADREFRQRLAREAQAVASLSHPNVVTVHDLGETFIVMELVEGPSLAEILGRRPLRELVSILERAARGVAAAHARGLVHRDLKPSNILAGPEPKVADFGLARRVDATRLTQTGAMVGTVAYMAPEQVEGREVSPRTDVYALGVILYEMLARRLPYRAETSVEYCTRILTEDPSPPGGPPELAAVCLRAMEKRAEHRYASAGEFGDELRRWLQGAPVMARPPSAVRRLVRAFRRRWRIAAAVAAVAALALVGAQWFAVRRALERAELYLAIEKDLDVLRHKTYMATFRMTDQDYAAYEALAGRARDLMDRTGETAQGWHVVGRCREVLHDDAGAEAAYDRALAIDPRHGTSLYRKARLRLERALFDDDLLDAGRRREAHDILKRAIATTSAMEHDLAEAYRVLEETPREAPAFCDRALARWEREPFSEEFLLVAGIAEGRRGMIARATAAIERRKSYAEAWYLRGTARLILRELDGALADFDEAIRCDPRRAGPHNNRGAVFLERGDAAAARREFERAAALDPRWAVARSNVGLARHRLGDFAGAVEEYTAALAIEPRAGIFVNRAEARFRGLKDVDGAIADFSEALRRAPDHAAARLSRGWAWFERGSLDEAERDFTDALPQAGAYLGRANVREKRGDGPGVIADLEKALEVAPADWPQRAAVAEALKDRKR